MVIRVQRVRFVNSKDMRNQGLFLMVDFEREDYHGSTSLRLSLAFFVEFIYTYYTRTYERGGL